MGVNRKRLGRGEGLTERRLPSMAAGRGVWDANSFWTNQKDSKGLLTLCPRKYICNKRTLLPEVRLREARPPVSLALGSACFVPGPSWQRRGDAEQALGPFPAGCWQRIRTGPVPAAAQCYLFRAAATSGHTCTANSRLFFAFRLTVRNHGFRSWSWHPLRILNVMSSGSA